jgi:integrase/recombinase XerC
MTAYIDTPSADLIEDYETYMIQECRTEASVASALELLYRIDHDLRPRGLAESARDEIVAWLAQRHPCQLARAREGKQTKAWSRKTKATYHAHLTSFYSRATDEDDPWITSNPMRGIRRPRIWPGVPQPTPDDIVRLCVTTAAWPYRLHCILAAYAGLRPIEIAYLDREDITERWIMIRHGKGDKPAIIPTEPPVWRAVKDLPPGPITRKLCGRPADRQWVSKGTSQYLQETLHCPPHTSLRYLRHWHGTWLRRHYDLRTVQERMRHESLQTTQIYTAVTEAELLASTGALPDFTIEDGDVADGDDDGGPGNPAPQSGSPD